METIQFGLAQSVHEHPNQQTEVDGYHPAQTRPIRLKQIEGRYEPHEYHHLKHNYVIDYRYYYRYIASMKQQKLNKNAFGTTH